MLGWLACWGGGGGGLYADDKSKVSKWEQDAIK